MQQSTVLVVDDDPSNRDIISMILESESFSVSQAADTEDALTRAEQDHPDVVVLDMILPSRGGREVARQIKARYPATSILAISAEPSALPSAGDGVFAAAIAKPFEIDELVDTVRLLCPEVWYASEEVDWPGVSGGRWTD